MDRVMITLPRELRQDVDATAAELKQSRSQLVREALTELLRRVRQRQFDELLAEGYRETAEQAAEIAADYAAAQAAAVEGGWVWDE